MVIEIKAKGVNGEVIHIHVVQNNTEGDCLYKVKYKDKSTRTRTKTYHSTLEESIEKVGKLLRQPPILVEEPPIYSLDTGEFVPAKSRSEHTEYLYLQKDMLRSDQAVIVHYYNHTGADIIDIPCNNEEEGLESAIEHLFRNKDKRFLALLDFTKNYKP